MARTSFNYYLIKLNRLTAWLLLGMILIYLCTGFALCGKLHVDRLIQTERALALHKSLVWPLVGLVFPHAVISIYFAFRRWGWIGRSSSRETTQRSALR